MMNENTVRETRRADELKPGDWLALETPSGGISPADIAGIVDFQPPGEVKQFEITYRKSDGGLDHWSLVYDGRVALATEAEVAARRERAERAQRIADVRRVLDFLEANPELPVPRFYFQESPDPHGDVWNSGAEGLAIVTRWAEVMGAKVEALAERHSASRQFGTAEYCVIAWHKDGRPAEAEPKRGTTCEELSDDEERPDHDGPGVDCRRCTAEGFGGVRHDADPTGLAYSRADEADDPTPVSPGRVPPHTGAVTDEGLVDESEPGLIVGDTAEEQMSNAYAAYERDEAGCPSEPVAVAPHEISTAWKGDEPGECGAECRCGVTYDGFNSLAEAEEHLLRHIEAATSSTGLTKAADESRGALAGTTPVVTYFSFGDGHRDPDTGKDLWRHYVTVVAPTYEACREAMFASRYGREWGTDYLAGTARALRSVPRWTEHEVIVAPGTDQALADQALAASMRVLDAVPVNEPR